MHQPEHHFFEFGPFRLDASEGVLTRRGEPVHLTPKALKLLLVLVKNGNHIVEKDELMKQVWPDTVVEETNLAGNIHGLRQVLGEGNGEEKYIETIPKRGYRFVSKVRENLSGKTRVMRAELAWAYAMAGRRSDAIKIFDDLKDPSQKQISPWRKAVIHAALGEKDLALAQLELSYTRKHEALLWLKSEPTFAGLRSDPRFIDLERRIGFPE
jgi:DNA-binding winged helix-turn-helix (wHTH) protein